MRLVFRFAQQADPQNKNGVKAPFLFEDDLKSSAAAKP